MFTKEMQDALKADAEKLSAETGEEHVVEFYDFDDDEDRECPNCGGAGVIYCCFEEFACIDPEGGCDDCERRCDWCSGLKKPASPELGQILADALNSLPKTK